MKAMFPPNAKRVQLNTSHIVNAEIHRKMLSNAASYANKNRDEISLRLQELDHEWDTERVLEANAAGFILISIILGFQFYYAWFYVAGIVAFFLLQHALQGWCPPLPIIRRLGIRTASEINDEKMALKALRGDFNRKKP
ncbi:MAG: DUF2892 domain-containing protein [Veillonellaceae bacterium]|mgnify:CR=1 FL=1|jgi:hypothetical protein|nr:DUF2892 domain-containing protein [Veillonellaceae bacterium]